jgi:anti-anti-sigma factor
VADDQSGDVPGTALSITSHRESAGVVRLRVTGEIDMGTAPQLAAAARRELTAKIHSTVLVDLSAVTFLDAAGISALLTVHHHAVRNANALNVGTHGVVRRVLDLINVLETLTAP